LHRNSACQPTGLPVHAETRTREPANCGSQADGSEVILTPNEVRHAREYPCTALFILSNITIERADDGTVTAAGGNRNLFDPWPIDDGTLTPLGFRYQVPDRRIR
jgi:hypothetical protein